MNVHLEPDPSEPSSRASAGGLSPRIVADSLALSAWTIVSRVTGVARVIAIAAVLGPTYLGNTYQATNTIPNIFYFGFLAGSMFASLLVPALVRELDSKDPHSVERLARGFMGTVMFGFGAVVVLSIAAGPLVMNVLSLGVTDPGIAAAQRRVGWPLLAMLMPQVVLYGIAGVAGAVMNAHRRFALVAAAPAFENLGIIGTLLTMAHLFGTGISLREIETPQLLLLGLGTTGAVALHAGALWGGARRLGITLLPRLGWHDQEVRALIRRVIPSLGNASLSSLQILIVLVVANAVSGGVVAFQLGLNFFWLPTAIAVTPVSLALLPQLSRMHARGHNQFFRDELVRGFALTLFLTVPVAVAYIALALPIAKAVAFGKMATPAGVSLVAASLASLGIGVLGHAAFSFLTHAAYAQEDARSPFVATVVGTGISIIGMVVALFLQGRLVLAALGLALSTSNLASAWYLGMSLRRRLPSGGAALGPSMARAILASIVMVGPAYGALYIVGRLFHGRLSDLVGMISATVTASLTFIGLQALWGAPELESLRKLIWQKKLNPRTSTSPHDAGEARDEVI